MNISPPLIQLVMPLTILNVQLRCTAMFYMEGELKNLGYFSISSEGLFQLEKGFYKNKVLSYVDWLNVIGQMGQ